MSRTILYVGTVGEGLWRSTDGGVQWERASRGMYVECDVRALAVDPRNPAVVFAGTNEGLYRSEDGGDHWTHVDSPMDEELAVWALLVLPREPEVIFAGTRPARLYRSEDGGRTWERLRSPVARECPSPNLRVNRVTTLRLDPEERRRIWAGVEIDAVWRSDDGGESWSRLDQGLSSLDIHGLAIVPAGDGRPRTILASTNNDLNVSTDEGRTWQPQQIGSCFPWPYCRGVAQRLDRPEVVLVGNGDAPPGSVGAAWRSPDGGRTWQRLALPATPNSTIWDFALHPADSQRIYAYSVSGEVYGSADGGERWQKLPREFGEIRSMLWVPGS